MFVGESVASSNEVKMSVCNESATRPQTETGASRIENPDELVVYKSIDAVSDFVFDNRWMNGTLVDYDKVEAWDDRRLKMDSSNLMRIKILRLPRDKITAFLSRLSAHAPLLTELNIDKLELLEGSQTEYTFDALKRLRIDAVRQVDQLGLPAAKREMAPPQATVKFNARQLKTVDFGKDTIKYVLFSNYRSIRAIFVEDDRRQNLPKFVHLDQLVLNEIELIDLEIFMKLSTATLGSLKEIYCNLHKITSASFNLKADELLLFETVYEFMRRYLNREKIDAYFHGVKVDLNLPFRAYAFDEKLIACHYQNFVFNELELAVLPSVIDLDFSDLYDVSCAGEFGQIRFDRESNQLVSRTLRISQLYPNLQRIVLEEKEERRASEPLFYALLRDCRALRELDINNSGFSLAFYDRIATLGSLKTLTDFSLQESQTKAVRLNFDFLQNWKYLLRFTSNLVNLPLMIRLIQRMQPGARFAILFFSDLQKVNYDVIIEKKSASRLEIILDDVLNDPILVNLELEHAEAYFNSGTHGPFAHWLDDLLID